MCWRQADGVVSYTGEGSRSIKEFNRSLRGRIQCVAAAHSLLSESSWHGVGLDNLIRAELARLRDGDERQDQREGCDAHLRRNSGSGEAAGRNWRRTLQNMEPYRSPAVNVGALGS
jgi:HWE histidine kinase